MAPHSCGNQARISLGQVACTVQGAPRPCPLSGVLSETPHKDCCLTRETASAQKEPCLTLVFMVSEGTVLDKKKSFCSAGHPVPCPHKKQCLTRKKASAQKEQCLTLISLVQKGTVLGKKKASAQKGTLSPVLQPWERCQQQSQL